MAVLSTFGSAANECEALFDMYQINSLFFYKDVLSTHYGRQVVLPNKHAQERSKTSVANLTRIKKEVLKYMMLKDLNVEELFAVLSKKGGEISE